MGLAPDTHGTIATYLQALSSELSLFLEKILPTCSEDWWKNNVLAVLSVSQQRRVEQFDITTLSGFDFAALLRVLDQNWYQLSQQMTIPSEARHFVKEAQTIRNRWAHSSVDEFSHDDVYRDLDTLQRFAIFINASDQLIQSLKETKYSLLATEPHHNSEPAPKSSTFTVGQIVCLKSKPTSKGAVIGVAPSASEDRIQVFLDGGVQHFYASQLQAETENTQEEQICSCDRFHAYLTALHITSPSLSTLYSLNAARVDFIPYQFRPVMCFIRSDRPRLLIADSVGVGKTIEAGLILRELQARRDIRSVLIICPRPLVVEKKWQREMKRFEERFTQLDGATLRYCVAETDLEGAWPEQHQKTIVPYSLFDETLLHGLAGKGKNKKRKGLLELDPPPRFDLVIVDEAHHARNQDTFRHKAVKFFCDNAEAVVFLTATPIQLGNNDLFTLLNMLRPDLIIDHESYQHMAEPNPHINGAVRAMRTQASNWQILALQSLNHAAHTSWGRAILCENPVFNTICAHLEKENITPEERVRLISQTEELHTFAGIINRTRRRDIGNFTVRKPETVVVPFTPEQELLHDELLRIQAEILGRVHGERNVAFMMTTIRRQAASCLFGLAPLLEEILSRHLDELAWEESDGTESPNVETVEAFEAQIEDFLQTSRTLSLHDPKLEELQRVLRDKQHLSNNKVMLFSAFKHTLRYLLLHLQGLGLRVGMVNGDTPDEERIKLRTRFEQHKDEHDTLDVLLFSEVGCEGLDYQFCDCIVNYDIPWNPMRIEQRIGRIDRKGQSSESVAIINFITPHTVEADIYERCLMRIGVFNNALGDCEEILGGVSQEIKNIANSFTLNEAERNMKLQQLADNKILLIQEQERLEQEQAELFGIQLPQDQLKREITEASSFWLLPASLRRMVNLYLQDICGKDQEVILGEKALKTLRLAQDARARLLKDFQQLPKQSTVLYREWENWLRGGNPHLTITFESECAIRNPDAAFIMPLHPLVKQAAVSQNSDKRILTHVEIISDSVPKGSYPFAIYQWRYHGVREDLKLKPIALDEVITPSLGRLLEHATDSSIPQDGTFTESTWDTLDIQHYQLWKVAREEHTLRTKELVAYQRESLTTSHRARVGLLEEQLNQATNEKIVKMRESQLNTANADYARHIQKLDIATDQADIIAEPVAYGVLRIIKGSKNV